MTTPNKITVFRFILIPIFTVVFLLESAFPDNKLLIDYIAVVIFAIAAISDFFDGYLARKNHQITDFGKLMDPLADKMLVCTALICFVQLRENFPCWCAVVVVAREFIISGFRQLAAEKKTIIMASIWGKAKTFVSLIMCILFIIDWEYGWFTLTETVFMYVSTALTVISLADYLKKNWQVMRDCTK
jgi:CDP-diacylglycerol--glycerol-3-phosphate 3-phosphatidyltransferase